ncbi:hypothetical protein FHX37_2252 [Haloactinospora alba]|uniref:Uncharacterized protein n=1 Tax=Haloactinospora alba TaxID=405555 RepID=A0A543NKB4_9ACTN|nr:hypothetical protein FHX37_2252 [Haloactinospora alba]
MPHGNRHPTVTARAPRRRVLPHRHAHDLPAAEDTHTPGNTPPRNPLRTPLPRDRLAREEVTVTDTTSEGRDPLCSIPT